MPREEIDIAVKIHLESWNYSGDWGCEAKATYTDAGGQSITLEYNNERTSTVIEEVAKDLQDCLEDHESWWSEKIIQGNDLVLKIREAEKQLKHYRDEARNSREWAERYDHYAAKNEQQLKELQSQAKEKQ